jgi:hypothetical protein
VKIFSGKNGYDNEHASLKNLRTRLFRALKRGGCPPPVLLRGQGSTTYRVNVDSKLNIHNEMRCVKRGAKLGVLGPRPLSMLYK